MSPYIKYRLNQLNKNIYSRKVDLMQNYKTQMPCSTWLFCLAGIIQQCWVFSVYH